MYTHVFYMRAMTHVNKESWRSIYRVLARTKLRRLTRHVTGLTIAPGDCARSGGTETAPHRSTSSVDSGASGLVGDKVALSVLIEEAGERGLHCISSLLEVSLLRLSSDSTAVLVR